VAELGRDAPWDPQDANPDCSADAYRDAKSHSENAKQPFFAERGRINKSSVRLHVFGLADSAPHNKSAAPGHVDLDFALPSVQLAGRLLAERESKQFPSRAEAAQCRPHGRALSRRRVAAHSGRGHRPADVWRSGLVAPQYRQPAGNWFHSDADL
jgi:hypothetical protein